MLAIALPRTELGTRAEARTAEVKRCLLMHPAWIFMSDLDQTLPLEGLVEFYRYAEEGAADIIVVDAPSRGGTDSNIRCHPNGELAYATISCCLIKASLFSRISEPWFDSSVEYREVGIKDGLIQWEAFDKYQDDNRGEDVYFMRKCIEQGAKIEVIPALKCSHHGG